jgi:hypothetical protein
MKASSRLIDKEREQLSSELVRLDRAIEALTGINGAAQARRRKRHMSAAARAHQVFAVALSGHLRL